MILILILVPLTLGVLGTHGRKPRGYWKDSPPKTLRWGDGPCIRPPNILRSSVAGCARKYEQSKKRCHQGIMFWNRAFSREERVIYDISQSKDMGNLKKHGRWLKKRHHKFWTWKWKFFPKKRHSLCLSVCLCVCTCKQWRIQTFG